MITPGVTIMNAQGEIYQSWIQTAWLQRALVRQNQNYVSSSFGSSCFGLPQWIMFSSQIRIICNTSYWYYNEKEMHENVFCIMLTDWRMRLDTALIWEKGQTGCLNWNKFIVLLHHLVYKASKWSNVLHDSFPYNKKPAVSSFKSGTSLYKNTHFPLWSYRYLHASCIRHYNEKTLRLHFTVLCIKLDKTRNKTLFIRW